MNYASTFLSHNSKDKPLVELVARELGRRGIVPWLDVDELDTELGGDLNDALAESVRRQATLTLFLSEHSLNAPWVQHELETALQIQQELGDAVIFPVYIGDPLKLVAGHERLRTRWLHPDGQRVKIMGEIVEPGTAKIEDAVRIAQKIAKGLYRRLQFAERREAIVCLDQRGNGGKRTSNPPIPANLRELNAPALVFRHDRGERSREVTVHGEELNQLLETIGRSLGEAFGTIRIQPKAIYLCGEAQLALPFMIGKHFDRTTSTTMYCFNSRDGNTFSNKGQDRLKPLANGNANCETSVPPEIPEIALGEQITDAALLLVKENYVSDVLNYMKATSQPFRPVWVKGVEFSNSEQAMNYVADVVALLARLKRENGLNRVRLFIDLPFAVTPLLAANLLYAAPKIEVMEFRKDLLSKGFLAEDLYFEVPSP
ncbi:MAG TPA: toll/interleukin-1 receptor domain-containing protein [Blastocatellia bacterium]|nr:toll/interleukin-1 receptor domain-containing protein [Blastocatellia bacterium]